MIDVFIRQNFTTDSNAMVVGFLREFAEMEAFLGNSTGATSLNDLADKVEIAVNALLWAYPGVGLGGDDHYITQRNPDNSSRDFCDYDANLIAVAHHIPDVDRAKRVLQRVDQGRCSAAAGAGPQFVSEVYYGEQDTTHGNVGDSWCSMGRIALFDGHARKYVGDEQALSTFDNHILGPLQNDLIENTWMHERYGCDGQQQQNRTSEYFEYPCTVAMLLREIRYGIHIGFFNVTVDPFLSHAGTNESTNSPFHYHVGNINVDFNPDNGTASLSVPGHGHRNYVLVGFPALSDYRIGCTGTGCIGFKPISVRVQENGRLSFSAPIGTSATVSVSRAS
jgi:hypothetical protein